MLSTNLQTVEKVGPTRGGEQRTEEIKACRRVAAGGGGSHHGAIRCLGRVCMWRGRGRGPPQWRRDRKDTDLDRAASSYPSSPSSSTDEGSKSLMTVDTGSAVLATIFVCQLSGAVIYLRGPQRTSANCGELQRTSPEPLRNSRISSNPHETW